MINPSMSAQLRLIKSGWDALDEQEKIENLISRIRCVMSDASFSASEWEVAFDIALSAVAIMRTQPAKEAA